MTPLPTIAFAASSAVALRPWQRDGSDGGGDGGGCRGGCGGGGD